MPHLVTTAEPGFVVTTKLSIWYGRPAVYLTAVVLNDVLTASAGLTPNKTQALVNHAEAVLISRTITRGIP